MALVDLQQTVEDLDASLSSIENVLDPEAKKAEIADLERQVAVPNLWEIRRARGRRHDSFRGWRC